MEKKEVVATVSGREALAVVAGRKRRCGVAGKMMEATVEGHTVVEGCFRRVDGGRCGLLQGANGLTGGRERGC